MFQADDDDFTAFVNASSRRLLRTAYLITGDLDSAQDLLQTALERTYRRWDRIRRRELPEAYLRRIVVNVSRPMPGGAGGGCAPSRSTRRGCRP